MRLRDGSIEMHGDAQRDPPDRGASRRISSSVSEDLPAPPVPVMPSTGTLMAAAACSSAPGARAWRTSFSNRGDDAGELTPVAGVQRRERVGLAGASTQIIIAQADHIVDHPLQAHASRRLPANKDASRHRPELADLAGDDDAAAAAEHLDVLAAGSARSRSIMYLKNSTCPPW